MYGAVIMKYRVLGQHGNGAAATLVVKADNKFAAERLALQRGVYATRVLDVTEMDVPDLNAPRTHRVQKSATLRWAVVLIALGATAYFYVWPHLVAILPH
jgi:hypothetical protein